MCSRSRCAPWWCAWAAWRPAPRKPSRCAAVGGCAVALFRRPRSLCLALAPSAPGARCLVRSPCPTLHTRSRACLPQVRFETSVRVGDGVFDVNVTRSLAPIGADRFFTLVKGGYFNGAAFFRVVPGFVVQVSALLCSLSIYLSFFLLYLSSLLFSSLSLLACLPEVWRGALTRARRSAACTAASSSVLPRTRVSPPSGSTATCTTIPVRACAQRAVPWFHLEQRMLFVPLRRAQVGVRRGWCVGAWALPQELCVAHCAWWCRSACQQHQGHADVRDGRRQHAYYPALRQLGRQQST